MQIAVDGELSPDLGHTMAGHIRANRAHMALTVRLRRVSPHPERCGNLDTHEPFLKSGQCDVILSGSSWSSSCRGADTFGGLLAFFCVGNGPVGDAYVIAPKGAVLRLPVLYVAPRPAARLAIFPSWHSIALVAMRHRNLAFPLVVASALSGAVATWALTGGGGKIETNTSSFVAVQNETVVYQQPRRPPPDLEQESSEHPYTEQIEATDELEDDNIPSNFVHTVQTLRFVNLDATTGVGKVTAAARESEDAGISSEKVSIRPRKRDGSIMDEVDDYLWEVYQRVPTKKDGSGDFTWKDPAAAEHMGLSLQDYVIGGMDPEFRKQLYHAGRAMDAAGLQWSMLSAFRDDYRQGLASGYKASASNSLHGGSRRTGGYGHGRAIDITGPDGREEEVWKWIDAHGAKYGLTRPLPARDPAHVQQRGAGDKAKVAAAGGKPKARKTAKAHKTAVASAR